MTTDKKEILVADDEAGFQALFRYMLEPLGFKVLTVDDGEQALSIARERDFALIFLDVHMPKMTGPEVLKNLRDVKPMQPVVILSSSPEPDKIKLLTEELGVSACFQKPFDTKDIYRIIDKIIGERKK